MTWACSSPQRPGRAGAAIGKGGLLKGSELAQVFASLRANDLIWPYVVKGYLKGQAPPAFDLLYWNSDDTNLPGPMFCWYLRNCYLENNIREPGGTTQLGGRSTSAASTFPPFSTRPRRPHRAVEVGVREHAAADGRRHVRPRRERPHRRCDQPAGQEQAQLLERTTRWTPSRRAGSSGAEVPGSWWPDWYAWLARHSGQRIAARTALGNKRYRPIEPAPGRYVKARTG